MLLVRVDGSAAVRLIFADAVYDVTPLIVAIKQVLPCERVNGKGSDILGDQIRQCLREPPVCTAIAPLQSAPLVGRVSGVLGTLEFPNLRQDLRQRRDEASRQMWWCVRNLFSESHLSSNSSVNVLRCWFLPAPPPEGK